MEIYAFEPPFFTEKNHPDILKLSHIIEAQNGITPKIYGANGTSDARHF
jgi:acetylornithine deacetylase/succinyl-diaminopimelate desuccinylase-like protein